MDEPSQTEETEVLKLLLRMYEVDEATSDVDTETERSPRGATTRA